MDRDQINAAVMDALRVQGNGGWTGVGGVAGRLIQSNMSVASLRTNDVLRKEEWLQYDRAVMQVARQRMGVVQALMGRGLVFPLGNALGTTVLQHELASDVNPAQIDMSGVTEGERDRQEFSLVNLPIPIVHKGFQVNIRNLESSRRSGTPLDTSMAAMSGKVVAEAIERMVIAGVTMKAGGGEVKGILNAPNASTDTWTADWDTTTGENIILDVLRMIDAAQAKNHYGPYILFVTNSTRNHMNSDFKTNSDRTILERVLAIPEIVDVVPSSFMTANKVALVELASDVIEIVDGMQPTTIMWDSHGGMLVNFKVMAIMVPRVRYDMANQSGIVIFGA